MLKFVKGDITDNQIGIIAHGCNCSGGFGSGVAGAIKKKWPDAHHQFKKNGSGKHLLGLVDLVPVKGNTRLWIANCYTQEFYGKDGQRYASPHAIRNCLRRVYTFANEEELPVKAPMIGCGLGGLNWDDEVEPIFQEMIEMYDIPTYVYYL